MQVEFGSAIFLVEVGCLGVGEVFESATHIMVLEEPIALTTTGSAGMDDCTAGEVDVVLRLVGEVSTDVQIHGDCYAIIIGHPSYTYPSSAARSSIL